MRKKKDSISQKGTIIPNSRSKLRWLPNKEIFSVRCLISGVSYEITFFTCHCLSTDPEEIRLVNYEVTRAVWTEPSDGWPIDVAPSVSFDDLEALEMEEPNPLRAQPTSTPHLMLQSHVSTNTGVLINTLRTANKSGYLEGGVIIISNPCRPKIATYTTWIYFILF